MRRTQEREKKNDDNVNKSESWKDEGTNESKRVKQEEWARKTRRILSETEDIGSE